MASLPQSSGSVNWFLKCLAILLGVGVTTLFLLGITAYSVLGLGGEARLIRDTLFETAGDRWERQVEAGVGPCILALVRAGLSFVELEPEVRTAMSSLRAAQAGVYRWTGGGKQVKGGSGFEAADRAMAKRGWDRIVSVDGQGAKVIVYARGARDMLKVCLIVEKEDDLVLVSARGDLKPLFDLAMQRQLASNHGHPVQQAATKYRKGNRQESARSARISCCCGTGRFSNP